MTTTEAIEYTTWGPVRGQGPIRNTIAECERDLERDARGCARQGGYSDREVVRVTESGRLETLDGAPVWPSHGRSTGAVRVER